MKEIDLSTVLLCSDDVKNKIFDEKNIRIIQNIREFMTEICGSIN